MSQCQTRELTKKQQGIRTTCNSKKNGTFPIKIASANNLLEFNKVVNKISLNIKASQSQDLHPNGMKFIGRLCRG